MANRQYHATAQTLPARPRSKVLRAQGVTGSSSTSTFYSSADSELRQLVLQLAELWQIDTSDIDRPYIYTEYPALFQKGAAFYEGEPGGGGGTGGGLIQKVYDYSALSGSFDNSTLTDTFNAYTIAQLAARLSTQENAGYVTSAVLASALASKADKATTLAGYGISDGVTQTGLSSALAGYSTKTEVANTYLPLSGGTLTGQVAIHPSNKGGSLVVAGSELASGSGQTSLTADLPKYASYFGTFTIGGTWYNVLSLRHRNGAGDGDKYGMYLYTNMTAGGNLVWNKQTYGTVWQGERTLLDSANFNSYAPTKTGDGATGTWGIDITGKATRADLVKATSVPADNTGTYYLWGRWTTNYGTTHWEAATFSNLTYTPATNLLNCNISGNADRLDGYHAGNASGNIPVSNGTLCTDLYASRAQYIANLGNLTAVSGTTAAPSGLRLYAVYNNGYPCTYGNLLRVGGIGAGELLCEWTGDSPATLGHLYYRSKRDTTSVEWSSWGKLAFITDNVASATKLQTARSIWGQSFNGDDDVSGALTGVTEITNSGRYLSANSGVVGTNGYQCQGGGIDATFGINPDTGGAYVWVASAHALRFATSRVERMRITAAGQVGIGTTDPTAALHIVGASAHVHLDSADGYPYFTFYTNNVPKGTVGHNPTYGAYLKNNEGNHRIFILNDSTVGVLKADSTIAYRIAVDSNNNITITPAGGQITLNANVRINGKTTFVNG